MGAADFNFPTEDLLPKKESGAISFLNKFPTHDGRGTVIAIFDSGVDPRAQGLQVTTDGKRKIIDCFDGSGAGDVSLVKAEVKDGTITGLSGRTLKIPDNWNNPTGEYRIGLKSLYELYPSTLKERMMREFKEKEWDPHHKLALAEAIRKLHTFEVDHPSPTGSDKLLKEELEVQIEMLNTLEKKYKNIGPCFDCVVFHDGEKWRACLDTSFKGNFSECQVLGVYRETFDIGILSEADQLSYTINVHDEGNILEIVTLCTSHGTHVASIAAAHFPDDPARNGLAPGAQIVSISIGDARLKSMETGTSLVRAMIRVMEMTDYKVDVINMSYGEHAHWAHSGRIGELMSEVVNKYGIIWVVSGSNNGPALTTIGTPPAIATSTLIGVGAYVSPEMMAAEYSLRDKLPGMPYTWSSRGPALDGSMGISICAPGGAITSVPKFLLRGSQLMNGTSMSAPHVTGAIALLVSGLKARSVPFSPFSVKRALEHTAMFLDGVEVFAQGHGLIQIDRAFDHLIAHHSQADRDVRFHVTIGNTLSHKGIYMRDTQTSKSKEFNINVEPFFLNNEERDAASKINFNLKLALACNSSWVQIPKHLDLMFMLRGFSVKVDPTGLAPGVHHSCVKAYDSTCPEKGAVFEVPVTVVKPEPMTQNEITFSKQHFASGDIQRRFIAVPKDATWAVVSIELENKKSEANNARFMIHALQMVPEQNCKAVEFQKFIELHEKSHLPLAFAVKGGRILELCLAKWWASLGTVQITYTITFHGISSRTSCLSMHGGKGIMRLDLESSSSNEEVAPVVTLTHQVQSFRPIEAKILPLGSRDVIRNGRQIYELILMYNFNVPKATEVTPDCALLSDTLYESEFESQLWMIHDCNKQYIAAGDAYPSHYAIKLEKGDYILRLHVRHEKKDLLDKLQDTPILISQKLSSSVSIDVYGTHSQALIQGKKLSGFTIREGDNVPIYLSPLNADKCCKTVSAGQYLSGTISFAKDELGKKVDTHPFIYNLVEPKKAAKTDKIETEKSRNNEEEMAEAVRDLKISWIKKLETPELRTAVYEELVKESPDHLPIYIARLQALEAEKVMDWKAILETANIALKFINVSELLEYYGLKSDNRTDAAKIKSRMEKNKTYLLEILLMKGLALCEGYNRNNLEQDTDSVLSMKEEILDVYNDITKFVEASDTKVNKFSVSATLVQNHYGRALRLVHKQFEEKPTRELETKLIELFQQLKWTHCYDFFNRSLPLKYLSTYRPF